MSVKSFPASALPRHAADRTSSPIAINSRGGDPVLK